MYQVFRNDFSLWSWCHEGLQKVESFYYGLLEMLRLISLQYCLVAVVAVEACESILLFLWLHLVVGLSSWDGAAVPDVVTAVELLGTGDRLHNSRSLPTPISWGQYDFFFFQEKSCPIEILKNSDYLVSDTQGRKCSTACVVLVRS